jgi:PEGA domain
MMTRRAVGLSLLTLALSTLPLARVARADDQADEAELQFEIGADRYKAGDFRGALGHFLASNRLAPNRNVVFNVARAYEQLGQSPDAYRYYNQALAGEQDPAAQARIAEAIGRIEPLVAVLQLDSDPPGATIYVTRRDLGARGTTPLTMGLSPGHYVIFADLPGYEPLETPPQELRAGTRSHLVLPLKQVAGTLRVEGSPAGAEIRLDDEGGRSVCTLPCATSAPPGRYTVFASAHGYQTRAASVRLDAGAVAAVRIELEPITGTLLVASEVRNALVTVTAASAG